MKKSQRWTEKCFKLFLWMLTLVFAWFLLQLGSNIIADLPKIEATLSVDDFVDKEAIAQLEARRDLPRSEMQQQQDILQALQEKVELSNELYKSSKTEFDNWLETRRSIQSASQDNQLIARTNDLNALQQAKQKAEHDYKIQQGKVQAAQFAYNSVDHEIDEEISKHYSIATTTLEKTEAWQELKVFFYRLALTLPLLVIAGWAYIQKRKTDYWPFVWGFIIFALFSFFVELVPYLPSYGGYVRLITGIILSIIIGIYLIRAFKNYLRNIKELETEPETQRRNKIDYDMALTFLQKERCPGCERNIHLKDEKTDFCPHCGLHIFSHCNKCHSRKSNFSPFCFSCGTSSYASTDNKFGCTHVENI
ncbi:serine endopeptidase [Bartonella sp. HY329]|uniref:serine endopeptidase n=1 Tax=unclassified Bartonella TaxID=2645622 RepID=UPI0021C840E0|nr:MULTISPECIES: serine endopeptidase [unclassified Bartonella]UXM96116.1 serine endopeptidase [Bartonella sp. HY329]UXN10440.1 serine endopeptidase [Bartonella sp. HY328]